MINTDMPILDEQQPIQLPKAQEKQMVPRPTWLGRDLSIIYPKSPSWIAFQAVISAILVAVGALIFSAHPILGGLLIAGGALMGVNAIKKMIGPDKLEEVVKYLANTDNLDALPEKEWEIKKYTDVTTGRVRPDDHITTWKPSDMTHDIMALKEDGKTIAVAFKFKAGLADEQPLEENYVKVIALKDRLMGFSSGRTNGIPSFSLDTCLFTRDVEQYAKYFNRPQSDEILQGGLSEEDISKATGQIEKWTNNMKEYTENLKRPQSADSVI